MACVAAGHSRWRTSFHVGDWTADPESGRLARGEEERHLPPMTMDLLRLLAEHAGQVVGKDQILDEVWEGRFVSESALTRAIAELRRLLDDHRRPPRYIETVPKRGYRLVALVEGPRQTGPPRLAVLPFDNLTRDRSARPAHELRGRMAVAVCPRPGPGRRPGRRTLELHPEAQQAVFVLALADLASGRAVEAVSRLEAAVEAGGELLLSCLGHMYGRSGQAERARAIMARFQETPGAPHHAIFTAQVAAGLGEFDLAFEALERAWADRDTQLFWLPFVPTFDPLRADQRFGLLLSRMAPLSR